MTFTPARYERGASSPTSGKSVRRLQIVRVAIDGLQPEHASGAHPPPTIAF